MTWNNRIVRHKDGSGFGLHEVLYDDEGLPWAMTEEPVGFFCGPDEGPEGVRLSLLRAMDDITKHPVFDEPEVWPGKPPGEDEGETEPLNLDWLKEPE